ncbi:MAG: hypothetical protein DMF70_09065, partial [Acidobacteria bacterium]
MSANRKSKIQNGKPPMTPREKTARPLRAKSVTRPESHAVLLALILTFSIMMARLMGGGARMAGGTAEKFGILMTLVVAILDLGVFAGLTGKTVGKWTTGLRIERPDGRLPGIPRALLRHFVGYPIS